MQDDTFYQRCTTHCVVGKELHHERQDWIWGWNQHCLLHAVNNILQGAATFSTEDFEGFCEDLVERQKHGQKEEFLEQNPVLKDFLDANPGQSLRELGIDARRDLGVEWDMLAEVGLDEGPASYSWSDYVFPGFGKQNPHRSALGLGNYGEDVLHEALGRVDAAADRIPYLPVDVGGAQNFDGDRSEQMLRDVLQGMGIEVSSLLGIIVNEQSRFLGRHARHWYAVIPKSSGELGTEWWNVDSHLKRPQQFISAGAMIHYILVGGKSEVFAVFRKSKQ